MKKMKSSSSHSNLLVPNSIVTSMKNSQLNEAIDKFKDELTPFEKSEIYAYHEVHCIGNSRVQGMKNITDKEGFYKVHIGE